MHPFFTTNTPSSQIFFFFLLCLVKKTCHQAHEGAPHSKSETMTEWGEECDQSKRRHREGERANLEVNRLLVARGRSAVDLRPTGAWGLHRDFEGRSLLLFCGLTGAAGHRCCTAHCTAAAMLWRGLVAQPGLGVIGGGFLPLLLLDCLRLLYLQYKLGSQGKPTRSRAREHKRLWSG